MSPNAHRVVALAAAALALAPAAAFAAKPASVESSLIVRFKDGTSAAAQKAVLRKVAAVDADSLGIPGTKRVVLAAGKSRGKAIDAIERNPAVEWVEKDVLMKVAGKPLTSITDALPRTSAWNMRKIDAAAAWDLSTGSGATVAVIDTGVDFTNPALAPARWTNAGEVAGNGVDDDANGFVDDDAGWDFASGDADPVDEHGHGTHVSGIIAGRGGAVSVVGVAPSSRIMPLQACTPQGSCPASGVAAAIAYAARMGADVVNMSLAYGADVLVVRDAVAANPGVLIVGASGNNGLDIGAPGTFFSPCELSESHENVVCVGATTSRDRLASFSNYGPAVTLTAPGQDIESTFLTSIASTIKMSGTSMAAPHVAGAAALMAARSQVAPSAMRTQLQASADVVSAGKRLNAQKTLAP